MYKENTLGAAGGGSAEPAARITAQRAEKQRKSKKKIGVSVPQEQDVILCNENTLGAAGGGNAEPTARITAQRAERHGKSTKKNGVSVPQEKNVILHNENTLGAAGGGSQSRRPGLPRNVQKSTKNQIKICGSVPQEKPFG